jgi:hypothetical protein
VPGLVLFGAGSQIGYFAARAALALVLGACIGAERRDDVALEAAVSRLSLEPSTSSVSWEVVQDEGVPFGAAVTESEE